MNKAVPWNVNGVGFNAREAAREAARRQGKSLGEWLHGVIADHASDIGVEAENMGSRQRIDAVTSKLERLSARSADHDRRLHAGRAYESVRQRPNPERTEDEADYEHRDFGHRNRREPENEAASNPILEEAIESMERRALRAERRADEAMQSVHEMLRRNEMRRDQEQQSVADLAQKLSAIESRLTRGFAQTEHSPIKGALAKLEARLEQIGRRGAEEAAIRPPIVASEPPAPPATPAPEPLERLEEKLNTILDAVHCRLALPTAEVSPIAMDAVRAAHGTDRRLGQAIAEISRHQQALEEDAIKPPASLLDALRRRDVNRAARGADEPSRAQARFAAMQSEIATLASKIEELHRDFAKQRRNERPDAELDGLRSEVSNISGMLRDLGPQGRVARLEDSVRGLTQRIETSFDALRHDTSALKIASVDGPAAKGRHVEPSDVARIEGQMREIRDLVEASASRPLAVDRIEQQIAALQNEPSTLETLVRDLGRKMEAAQAPDANHQAFDALQEQIATLASRFERSDDGLAKLSSLEKSMRELFAHLDETRASVETSSARAAREVLQIAMEEGRALTEQGTATTLATIQALQDEAEARTEATLSAVNETLGKVVDRLAVMETDIANVRARNTAQAPAVRVPKVQTRTPDEVNQKSKTIALGAADPLFAQVLGQRATELSRKRKDAATSVERQMSADLDSDAGRSDFIAAARRAAKAAQADSAQTELKASKTKVDSPVRAGLVAQSRDYVAHHKRPVLLSVAALFVIVGTMAVMQHVGLGGNDIQTADVAAPAAITSRTGGAAPQTTPTPQIAALAPRALPKSAPPLAKPIPGSDPVQTGSISSLPAFAAQGAVRAMQRPTLPAGLERMAKAGDADAEYVLGSQFAEGRLVPRDLKLAAEWYQKAADQGIAPAQYRLASLYEKGLGVAQDKAKAKTLYVRAAEAGNPRAMHNLAVLLADGDGKPDYEGAATWFRKAAQYGIHDSQYNLAILLARGLGTQQSLVQSYQWFAIAAAQNDSDAAKKRDEVGSKLTANDLAVAKALAISFRPRTADIAATEVQPPPAGWDGASGSSPVNSARAKISSL